MTITKSFLFFCLFVVVAALIAIAAKMFVFIATSMLASRKKLSTEVNPKTSRMYSSPKAVFDAFQNAIARGNYRKAFQCLTAENRDMEIYGLYLACLLNATDPKVRAVLKTHGLDPDKIDRILSEEISKQSAEKVDAITGGLDDKLDINQQKIKRAVLSLLKDKAAFYEDANRAMPQFASNSPSRDLVIVQMQNVVSKSLSIASSIEVASRLVRKRVETHLHAHSQAQPKHYL